MLLYFNNNNSSGDFPGGPVGKNRPSSSGVAGLIPGWEAKIPHASWPENKGNVVTNSIKTLNGPRKKKYFKKHFTYPVLSDNEVLHKLHIPLCYLALKHFCF